MIKNFQPNRRGSKKKLGDLAWNAPYIYIYILSCTPNIYIYILGVQLSSVRFQKMALGAING
jgi:hypothetical protein